MADPNLLAGNLGRGGFFVGNQRWLDSEASKVRTYWRAIEYGEESWVGHQIAGLWGPVAEPRGALWGHAESMFGGSNQEKFIPFFSVRGQEMTGAARKALWFYLRAHGYHDTRTGAHHKKVGSEATSYPTLGTITHPIKPHRFFEKALEVFDVKYEERRAAGNAWSFATDVANPSAGEIKAGLLGMDRPGRLGRKIVKQGALSAVFGSEIVSPDLLFSLSGSYQSLARNFQGRMSTFQRELVEQNRILAMRFQSEVVKAAEESIVRKDVSTKRLVEALGAPQNRFPQ